jgi:hypothetical protein
MTVSTGEPPNMNAVERAQQKVAARADELGREQPLLELDTEHPNPARRLSFEQSMKLIETRYSRAIELLGKL